MLIYECQYCRDEMTFIDNTRSKFCKSPECQRALVQAEIEQKKTKLQEHHKTLFTLYETHLKDLPGLESRHHIPVKLLESIEQNKPIVALLPHNNMLVTRLPEERKEEFLSHLKALFNDIKAGEETTRRLYSRELEAPLPAVESTLLGNACATCKGYCCGLGDTHAFQDYPSLKHYLSTQPADITENELAETYSSLIPSHSYQNACVFQGDHGCTLSRDMRSFTCNNYRCDSLITYQQDVAKSNSKLTYAAAVKHDTMTTTNIFDVDNFVPYR